MQWKVFRIGHRVQHEQRAKAGVRVMPACLESKLINIQHLNRIDILFLLRVVSDGTFPYSSILRIEL